MEVADNGLYALENGEIKFVERVTTELQMMSTVKEVLFEGKSKFQDVMVLDLLPWGKTLVLDGYTQSTAVDEKVYHESLVHPAMLACRHPPKRVFIGGGGELATAREVLKHDAVEKCVMVDIDELVVDMCREHLPEWGDGVTSDKRLELHYTDAYQFLLDSPDTYDVVIMDIADPVEAGPGIMLYTTEFYEQLKNKLAPGGVFVTQSGPAGMMTHTECFSVIHQTLQNSFETVCAYTAEIPSFGSDWGFNLAYDGDGDRFDTIDERLRQSAPRLEKKPLLWYDATTHTRMFNPPKYVRHHLAVEDRVMTRENPVFMI